MREGEKVEKGYIFCDWLTVIIPFKHEKRKHSGQNVSIDENGKIEYTKHRRKMIEASSSARVSIRSVNTFDLMGQNEDAFKFGLKIHCLENLKDKRTTEFDALEISGNPTKWLNRGHNIWGCDDIERAIGQFIKEVLKKADIELNLWELKQLRDFQIYPSRIDLTTNFRLSSESDAKRWLEAVVAQAKSKYQASKSYATSAYFGERSKIKTTVFYKKKEEFIKNSKELKKEMTSEDYKTILNETETLIRYEHRLQSQWFRKRNINTIKNFLNIYKKLNIMGDEMAQLKLGQMDLSDKEVNEQQKALFEALKGQRVRNSVVATFAAWKNGENPREMISDDTYWKHKKMILALTGIDITNQRVITKEVGKVVPLVQYITAYAAAPSASYEKLMYA